MKKHIVAFICALLLLFTAFSSLGTFASGSEVEEEPTLKELANLTKKASTFYDLMEGSYILWRNAMNERGPVTETDQWLISLGYLSKDGIVKKRPELPPYVDRHTGEEYTDDIYGNTPVCPLPKEITMDRLKKDYFDLFYYDIYEFFSCGHEHIVHNQPGGLYCFNSTIIEDTDGRIYIKAGEHQVSDIWAYVFGPLEECSEILFRSENFIVMAIYAEGESWYETVEFRKNAGGWRIYGGSAFNGAPPPETGDNTLVLLTVTAVSVLGLCALAVTVGRRKKERF